MRGEKDRIGVSERHRRLLFTPFDSRNSMIDRTTS